MMKTTFLQYLKLHLEDQTFVGRFARDVERLSNRPRGATGMHAWLTFINVSYHSETMTKMFADVWNEYRQDMANKQELTELLQR